MIRDGLQSEAEAENSQIQIYYFFSMGSGHRFA